MLSSESLLINIQLAIMGIVVVAGLFYLWRMICRVEKKVDDFIESYIQSVISNPPPHQKEEPSEPMGGNTVILNDADEFMNEVFGGMVIAPGSSNTTVPTVHVEEECAQSEAETQVTTTTSLSKAKLKKMSLDALKDACKERGLPTDGTKTVLQDRILATIDDTDE